MSGYVTGLVLKHSEMRDAARLVMVVIADAACDDGTNAWPTMEVIAQRANVDERTARRCVRACVAAGELICEQNAGGVPETDPRYRPNRYTIPISRWIMAEAYDVRDATPAPMPGGASVTARGDIGDPGGTSGAIQRGHLARLGGITPDPEGTSDAEAVDNPPVRDAPRPRLLEPDLRSKPTSKSKSKPPKNLRGVSQLSLAGGLSLEPAPDPVADFADWWASYPRRNGKRVGRMAAERVWQRLSAQDRATATVAVANYRQACDDGLTLAKDAVRWLRGRCWDDWLTPATPTVERRRDPLAGRHALSLDEVIAIASRGERSNGTTADVARARHPHLTDRGT